MSRLGMSTIQANRAVQGNFSTGKSDLPGIGVGIYVGSTGNVGITTVKGDTVQYTAVPAGTVLQVPLFKAITASETSCTDMTIACFEPPAW